MKYIFIAGILIVVGGGILFWLPAKEAPAGGGALPPPASDNGSTPPPTPSDPKTIPPPAGGPTPASQKPLPKPVGNQGQVVFGIKDKAVSLGDIAAITIIVKEVFVHSSGKGWISVSKTPRTYDLLHLHSEGAMEFLADANLEAGTYQQLRILVDKVMVARKGEALTEAKLPSNDIKVVAQLIIEKGKTSGVIFDILGDKSIHITGSGKYIVAPVVKLETKTQVQIQHQKPSEKFPYGKLDIFEGLTKFSGTFAMDLAGAMILNGQSIDQWANLEIEGGIIKILR